MKKVVSLFASLVVALGATISTHAAETVLGPKGGRLLETKPLRAEFFVTTDRKVEITFYDAALKPVAPAEQTVAITAEPKSGKQSLELEKTATGFVTKSSLPEGEPYRIVVQVKETEATKPQNFRLQMNLSKCGECSHPEYACTCGH